MEISEPTLSVFYASKMLALAPFSLRKNSKGVLEIRRSLIFCIYTASLSLSMVFLTYRGLLFDANSKIPVRMKSATSKVVTALDVSVVVMATSAGVLCGLLGLNPTRELNQRLQKIDESLHSFSNFKRDRLRALCLVIVSFFTIATLIGFDMGTWLRFAMKSNAGNTELNVQWYIPFYSLYFLLTGLHVAFANTAFGVARRYSRLNVMLRSTFLLNKKKNGKSKPKITTVHSLLQSPPSLYESMIKPTLDHNQHNNDSKNKAIMLKILAENHESLGKCVTIVSSSYGIVVLFILVSCLLHLVATSYFLFLEFLSKNDNSYLWLQIIWIFFHTVRLLMVVEPCHLATVESKKTIRVLCEIERKVHDPILAEEIKKFWQQLLVMDSRFSAAGLCKVNRNLLTSFSGAIATYLIILIQFQKTNG